MTVKKVITYRATWIGKRPAYYINGIRVSTAVGYQHSKDANCPLPEDFHAWHSENDKES